MTATPWRPVSAADRPWLGLDFMRVLTSLDVPDVARIRHAMAGLAEAAPEVRRWLSPAEGRWRPVTEGELDQWLDAVVVAAGESTIEGAFAASPPLGELPLRLSVGPDWIGLRQNHGLGDGWTNWHLLAHLLRQARAGAPLPVPWSTTSQRRRDLALARGMVGHAGTVVRALRARNELRGGRYVPANAQPAGRATTIVRVSPADFTARLRAVRDAHFRDASVAALTLVGLRAALDAVLPPARPGFECVFDTRGRAGRAFGNWSAGVYLLPADDSSPTAVSDAIARSRRSGLPIIASASLRTRRGSRGRQVPAAEGAPRLTLSFSHLRGELAELPGLDPDRSQLAIECQTNGVETITASLFEWAGRLHASLAFHPQVWPRAAVEGAVAAFLAEPERCLSAPARAGALT